jgi:hypothetical protein
MSGETESNISGWTTDTLHSHIDSLLDERRQEGKLAAEAVRANLEIALESALTLAHESDRRHLAHFAAIEEQIRVGHEHRLEIVAEADKRYEQRFMAQERAVSIAVAQADKEFHEHLQNVRVETHAALEAAEKAIAKAESSTEKRFDAVGQLADQAGQLLPRAEATVAFEATRLAGEARERSLREINDNVSKRVDALTGRMDRSEGTRSGMQDGWSYLLGALGAAGAVVAIIIGLLR